MRFSFFLCIVAVLSTNIEPPRLAWNSLQEFSCDDLTVEIVGEICTALKTSGMLKVGFDTIMLPSCLNEHAQDISIVAGQFEVVYVSKDDFHIPENFVEWSKQFLNNDKQNDTMMIATQQKSEQLRAQLSLFSIFRKNIYVGMDVRDLDDAQMYTNSHLIGVFEDQTVSEPQSDTLDCSFRVSRTTRLGLAAVFFNPHSAPCEISLPFDSYQQSKSIDSIYDLWSGLDVSPKLSTLTLPAQSARMFLINPRHMNYETPAASIRALVNVTIFSVILVSCFVITLVWRRKMRQWIFLDDGEEPKPLEGDEIKYNIQSAIQMNLDFVQIERRKLTGTELRPMEADSDV